MCKRLLAVALVTAAATAVPAGAGEAEVNLYSYRQPFLIQPMLNAFTEQTGIRVNVVYAEKGMLERLKAEGDNSPADAVLTADIGRLNDMVEAGVLQPVQSETLERNIPARYRHPEGLWYGLSVRARIILANRERVNPGEIATYEDLASPAFKGRVCTRSGKHEYTVSLIASVIEAVGEDQAEAWLRGVKDNLARKPQGNDRAQAKAIHEGVCDIAIANTYYVGKMLTNDQDPGEKAWAESVRIVFPNQADRGTHVNVSGGAVTRSAKNTANAIKLLEFLSDDYAQKLYAEQNFEYPVKAGVPIDPLVASWGQFRADAVALADVAKHRAAASRMVDRVGYDQGPGS